MKAYLQALNRTPGVLGSAYIDAETAVCDVGEALGGPAALPWAQRTAEACREWVESRHGMPLETAVFVGTLGRIVARPAGAGLLVAFAENDASAGLLRVRLREIAEQVTGDGTAAPQLQPLP